MISTSHWPPDFHYGNCSTYTASTCLCCWSFRSEFRYPLSNTLSLMAGRAISLSPFLKVYFFFLSQNIALYYIAYIHSIIHSIVLCRRRSCLTAGGWVWVEHEPRVSCLCISPTSSLVPCTEWILTDIERYAGRGRCTSSHLIPTNTLGKKLE